MAALVSTTLVLAGPSFVIGMLIGATGIDVLLLAFGVFYGLSSLGLV